MSLINKLEINVLVKKDFFLIGLNDKKKFSGYRLLMEMNSSLFPKCQKYLQPKKNSE